MKTLNKQTITSAKEKKKKWALKNCNCYPFLQYLQIEAWR